MKKTLIILLYISLLPGACTRQQKQNSDQVVISVSLLPEEYFVKQLAGDLVKVSVMIPPGANPATYEPTPRQLQDLSGSSLYMKIGYSAFESAWMGKISSVNPEMKITDLSRNIPLINEEHDHEGDHQSVNPHIWLSPENAKIIARNTATDLLGVLPADSLLIKTNLQVLLGRIDSLDLAIHSLLDTLENRSFIIYHPALSYFARDYNLQQYSLEEEGKEPGPAHMKYLADIAREKGIGVIFLQMQFDQHNAEALARETGAEIIQINPLDPNWYDQMLYIAETIRKKLK